MAAAARTPAPGARLCDALLFPADSGRARQLVEAQRGAQADGIGLGDFKRGTQRGTPAKGALSKFLDATPGLRGRVVMMLGTLVFVNLVLIGTTLVVSTRYPALISPAILAYTFGLRHAVDADHLAAIDNMTRRLMSEGQRPVTVGLYFSLGHSTIVFILSVLVAVATTWLKGNVTRFQTYGAIIGTSISAVFLIIIGLVNLWVLKGLLRRRREMRAKAASDAMDLSGSLHGNEQRLVQPGVADVEASQQPRAEAEANEAQIGFMNNCCPCVSRTPFRSVSLCLSLCLCLSFLSTHCLLWFVAPIVSIKGMVDRPWKMYPVGVLFGLGCEKRKLHSTTLEILRSSPLRALHTVFSRSLLLQQLKCHSGAADCIMQLTRRQKWPCSPSLPLHQAKVSPSIGYFCYRRCSPLQWQ